MSTVTPSRDDRTLSGRITTLAKKLKFDSHHEMERFRVLIAVITALGILVIGAAVYVTYKSKQVDITGTAQYTNGFTTSYTQQAGTVDGVYTNSDDTRAVLLFSFDGVMSRNPDDYEVFITGMNSRGNPTKVDSAMTARLLSFGDDSHMGLVMDAPDGFAMQVLNATVSSKRNLVSPEPMDAQTLEKNGYAGETFTTHDAWRMVFNPAGSFAEVLPELDEHDFNPRDFLINSVYREREVELRRAADDSLVQMRTAEDRISFYREAIADARINVPDGVGATLIMPEPDAQIAGDDVEGLSREELGEALMKGEAVEAIERKTERARELDTYDDGTMPTTYELMTRTAVRGGVQYDWRSTTIQDGYLKALMPAGYTPETYLQELRSRSQDAKIPPLNSDFMLSTGKRLDSYDVTDRSVMNLQSNAMSLVSSYRDFYTAKAQYQANDLVALLELEAELDDAAADTAVSMQSDNVTIKR